jgi:hypothetical protein
VPPSSHVCLVYSTERKITAAGGEVLWAFVVNSLFDPDYTYTGSQPPYFDQWSALYSKYRVVDTLIEAKVCNYSGAHCKVAMAPMGTDPSAYTTEDVAGWRNSTEDDFNSGGPMAVLRLRVKPWSVYGRPKQSVTLDEDWSANVGGDPGSKVFLALAAKTDGATDVVWMSVRITMSARFERPKVIALSAVRTIKPAAEAARPDLPSSQQVTPLVEHDLCVNCSARVVKPCSYCHKCGVWVPGSRSPAPAHT